MSDNIIRQTAESRQGSILPRSVALRLAERMAEGIFRGELAPGHRLVEADLQSRYAAGRSSVREALAQLQAQGLVTLEPNRGASVRRLNRSEVDDLFAIRERLESLAAATAARRVRQGTVSHEALERWSTLTARMARLARRGDPLAYGQFNREWHQCVLDLAGNEELARLANQLSLPIFQSQFRGFLDPDSQRASQAQHEAILESVRAGDAPASDRHMARHVRAGLQMVRRWADERFAEDRAVRPADVAALPDEASGTAGVSASGVRAAARPGPGKPRRS